MGRQVFGADAFARLVKQNEVPSDAVVRGLFAPKIKAIDESARSIDFTISTGMIDRDNDTISPAGWKLDAYLQNPVVLWAHDQSCPPVARAENTRIDSGALISTAIFTASNLNPFGDMIFRMYIQRFLNATSVGFKPIEYTMRSADSGSFGVDYAAQELLEYSCVAVPSNPQALARAKAAGIDTAPMISWCAKQIEQAAETKLPRELLQKLYRAAKGESPTVHHLAPRTKAEMAIFNLVRGELDRRHPGAKAGDTVVFDLMPDLEWTKGEKGLWSAQKNRPPVKAPADAGSFDPAEIEPYTGVLELGPEKMEPLDEGAVDKMEEIPIDPASDETAQSDPDGDTDPQDELPIDGENEDRPERTFETAGGPGDHEHEYDLAEVMTEEAGEPPHLHGVTWGQDGTVTIGEAEGHTHEPDSASLNQIEGDGMPNGTDRPQISDEAVPMRGLEEMLRKIVREELDARGQKSPPATSAGDTGPELILFAEEPEETKSAGVLDTIAPDELAGLIDSAVSAAMTRAIRRAQGKID